VSPPSNLTKATPKKPTRKHTGNDFGKKKRKTMEGQTGLMNPQQKQNRGGSEIVPEKREKGTRSEKSRKGRIML